eukprot:6187194-Pleurochrysis_carterae.AAC.1
MALERAGRSKPSMRNGGSRMTEHTYRERLREKGTERAGAQSGLRPAAAPRPPAVGTSSSFQQGPSRLPQRRGFVAFSSRAPHRSMRKSR